MTTYQSVWWEQAASDYRVYRLLLHQVVEPCHLLHYLQMATEKVAKAYLWRDGQAPSLTHSGLVQFLRNLTLASASERPRILRAFSFRTVATFRSSINRLLPIAYEVETLAPTLARGGPNPEYPWPHLAPASSPARHQFDLWIRLRTTPTGQQFERTVRSAILNFPLYS